MNTLFRFTAAALVLTCSVACSSDNVTDIAAPMGLALQLTPSVDTVFLTDSAAAAPVHLTLSATSFGQPVQTPKGVEWTIADPAVAIVDSTGGVRAVALGTTTLTARVNAAKAQATIVVAHKVAQVVLFPSVLSGFVGDSATITASALDASGALVAGTAYSFTVPDPTAIALTRTGTRTATAVFLKAGAVRINATADGFTGSAAGTIQAR